MEQDLILTIRLDAVEDGDIICFLSTIKDKESLVKTLLRMEVTEREAIKEKLQREWSRFSVQGSPLPSRVKNILQREGICSMGDLVKWSKYDLWTLPGMGIHSLTALLSYVEEIGVPLTPSDKDEFIQI